MLYLNGLWVSKVHSRLLSVRRLGSMSGSMKCSYRDNIQWCYGCHDGDIRHGVNPEELSSPCYKVDGIIYEFYADTEFECVDDPDEHWENKREV
jgi:hypothetical protein